jgi:hypothetical protein
MWKLFTTLYQVRPISGHFDRRLEKDRARWHNISDVEDYNGLAGIQAPSILCRRVPFFAASGLEQIFLASPNFGWGAS